MSIITVTTTADQGSGSLRNAITTAKSGDTIRFSKDLSGKTIRLTSGQLYINKDIEIDGAQADGLVISGENKSRVFYLDKKRKATLKNLTIANGRTDGAGGGIDTRHESEIVLENVNVHNNTSGLGGGMRVGHLAKATVIDSSFKGNDGTLSSSPQPGFSAGAISHSESRGQIIIKDTTFEGNKGYNGGALMLFSSVTAIVENSVFKNNTAIKEGGGAIYTDGVSSRGYNSGLENDGKIIIRGSEFDGNKAPGEGGALFLWGYNKSDGYKDDRAIIEDSVFTNNVVTAAPNGKSTGGAIFAHIGLDIQNTTFAENTATNQGGALWTESRLPINISNSTFSNNRAINDAGGAMFLNNRSVPVNITNTTIAYNVAGRANGALWYNGSHNVTLKNSIVAFNRAERDRRQDQVGYQAKDGGGNLQFAPSGALEVVKNAPNVDPRLGDLKLVDGTLIHPLLTGSPAVNAGVTQGAPKTDQRGITRDGQIDIGAFELINGARALPVEPSAGEPTFTPIKLTQASETLAQLISSRDGFNIFVDDSNIVRGQAYQTDQSYTGKLFSNSDGTNSPNDKVRGTANDDNIWAGKTGDDSVMAGDGNDLIGIGNGNATVSAGMGDDYVYGIEGGGGTNIIDLGEGNNTLSVEKGNYTVTAGSGADTIALGNGSDIVRAGNGDNIIYLSNNRPSTGDGDKDILTGNGDDSIGLGTGKDVVRAGNGNNVIYMTSKRSSTGDGDKDVLTGSGDDYIETGSGDDLIDGGNGFNYLFGGNGADTFTLRRDAYNYVGDFTLGADKIELNRMAFDDLSFYQGQGETAADAFIFVGSESIGQVKNVTVAELNNSANFS